VRHLCPSPNQRCLLLLADEPVVQKKQNDLSGRTENDIESCLRLINILGVKSSTRSVRNKVSIPVRDTSKPMLLIWLEGKGPGQGIDLSSGQGHGE
jgi:hypothetical protein